jgi:alpha-D-xyloside xylohydrolase
MLKNIHQLLLILPVLSGCVKKPIAELTYTNIKNFPVITLNDNRVKSPFIFSANDSGSVWFETVHGKTFLHGKTISLTTIEPIFESVWQLDNRIVKVSILKNGEGNYDFSFTAEPDSDILQWGFAIASTRDEYFTGLFERTVDGDQSSSWKPGITEAMNLRGQQIEMIIKPTLSLYCPFYISSNDYGLFIEGSWPGKYDFCKTDSNRVTISFEGSHLSGKIYTAEKPAEIVKAHSLHVGPTIVPPRWAFLPWRWRDNHVNLPSYYDGTPVHAPFNSQLVEDILMMQAFDIPCGVYWVDRPWAIGMHGYADFEWDPERLPNADEMIDWLHSRDTRFLLWIAPWVTGNMRYDAYAKGFTLPMKKTNYGVDASNAALIDFTNPEACRWWQENGIEKMLKQGVDGFKLDRSEETVPETRDIILADGRTAREVRNEYPILYVKAANESCRKIRGDDFVLIPRAGYSGSSKYSGFWGGDIGSLPEGLRAAIIAVQRNAINGFPVWGSDIGGYWQGDLDREVLARWLAFGCFTPIMEVGPTEDRAPWDMKGEPHYDTTLIAIWRLYAKIHAELADYSYGLVQEAHATGMPPIRPLFLIYPEEKEAWKEWQSFLYGPDILVYAIWQKGTHRVRVYLPKGEKWRDAWDSTRTYHGGQTIEVETPWYKIPLFIRQGSGLELGDLNRLFTESLNLAENKPDLQELEKTYLSQ